jgi:hypothetical protein
MCLLHRFVSETHSKYDSAAPLDNIIADPIGNMGGEDKVGWIWHVGINNVSSRSGITVRSLQRSVASMRALKAVIVKLRNRNLFEFIDRVNVECRALSSIPISHYE